MRKNEDKKNMHHGFAPSILIGAAVGFIVILVLFAVFAAIISSGKLSEDLMRHITVFVSLLGAVIGSFFAVKNYRKMIMPVALSAGAFMFLVTLLGSAFSDSGSLVGPMTPVLLITFISGSVLGGLLNMKRKKRKHAV